ncbi:MAG: hypothetical protein R2873_21270 [Caldilineaceae bacterium]
MKQEKRSRIVHWVLAGLFTVAVLASGLGFSMAEHGRDAGTAIACSGPCSDPGNGGG